MVCNACLFTYLDSLYIHSLSITKLKPTHKPTRASQQERRKEGVGRGEGVCKGYMGFMKPKRKQQRQQQQHRRGDRKTADEKDKEEGRRLV